MNLLTEISSLKSNMPVKYLKHIGRAPVLQDGPANLGAAGVDSFFTNLSQLPKELNGCFI